MEMSSEQVILMFPEQDIHIKLNTYVKYVVKRITNFLLMSIKTLNLKH